MVKTQDLDRIRELLSRGLSTRKIGKLVGVSRQTVSNIARGIIPGGKKEPSLEKKCELPESELPRVINSDSEKFITKGPEIKYHRCPTCGGKVLVGSPCLACLTKKKLAISVPHLNENGRVEVSPGLDCYLSELLDEIMPNAGDPYILAGKRVL